MLALNGKQKKALVLDCDNTLWKGIIGEDGIEGIGYNSDKKDGVYFEEVHHYIKFLQNEGVILALNSKNNFDDVKNFFTKGKRSIFIWDDFIVKKVNWDTKVTNLRNIAKELNIGLDSLVHIDDSDFEINHINAELPEVMTIQVPKNLKDYPNKIKEIIPLFLNRFKTNEDSTRSQLYNTEKQRKEEFEKIENIEDFLQSLELKLTIKLNDNANIVRIAQMTQKTNQFNLTTQRYSESEIENLIKQRQHNIFSFSLNDKFGDYGTTGLCIVRYKDSKKVFIETFLMSCRIIGRNAEYAFFDFLSNYLKMEKIESIESKYIRTFKNEQVSSFYENLGFKLEFSSVDLKNYQISLKDYIPKNINYLKVNYEAAD
jgi:FkbH-like protein